MIKSRIKKKIDESMNPEKIKFFEEYRQRLSIRDIKNYLELLKANRGTGKKVNFTPERMSEAEIEEKWRLHCNPVEEAAYYKDIRNYIDSLAQKRSENGISTGN